MRPITPEEKSLSNALDKIINQIDETKTPERLNFLKALKAKCEELLNL